MKLSPRLESALKHTEGFECLMDVGCDHAYLPIEAWKRGYVKKAIASDNKEAPFQNALENVKLSDASPHVQVIKSEGIEQMDDSVDILSILGMGGNMIVDILNHGNLKNVKRLILSPNSDPAEVRDFLMNNHLKIIDEEFVKDNDKYYQIMIIEHGEMKLNKSEVRFGPYNILKQSPEFVEYIHKLIAKLERGRQKARQITAIRSLDSEIKSLKECIK
ncbi:MAG: class I SAM-dependent methyltransferase [Firmicutes bacterium]|nr:class I SAM-dependent methyltransferase [Bacillota bacterium]